MAELAKDQDNYSAQLNLVTALLNWSDTEYELGRKDSYFDIVERAYRVAEAQRNGPGGKVKTFEQFFLQVLYYRAYAYVELKKPEAGRVMDETYRSMTRYAKDNPKDDRVLFYLCDLLTNLHAPGYDRPEEAKRYAERMIELQPQSPSGYEGYARAEMALGNYESAIGVFRKALGALEQTGSAGEDSQFAKNYRAKIAEIEEKIKAGPKPVSR
jgi:tetratricopeptide (TPR) repeat protein